jgi:plastocyanin
MKRVARFVIVSLVVVTAAACGGDDDGAAPTEPGVVIVDDNVFRPKTITVAPGDTVTWRFEGNSAHNVTADDFASELMKDGEFEHTFDEVGEYDYVCTVHAGMVGTVDVQ